MLRARRGSSNVASRSATTGACSRRGFDSGGPLAAQGGAATFKTTDR